MSIYVVSHKEYQLSSQLPSGYVPIYVGPNSQELASGVDGAVVDSTGDNIAFKNNSYSELTALYWIWRNCDDPIKGLVHYRRFFIDDNGSSPVDNGIISEKLSHSDIVLPPLRPLMQTVEKHYISHHVAADLEQLELLIQSDCLQYCRSYTKCINSHLIYPYNMLIATRSVFDDYCSWLFPLLEKFERRLDFEDRDTYQKRVFGFISERLMRVWVDANDLDVTEMKVMMPESGLKEKVSTGLGHLISLPELKGRK